MRINIKEPTNSEIVEFVKGDFPDVEKQFYKGYVYDTLISAIESRITLVTYNLRQEIVSVYRRAYYKEARATGYDLGI